MVLSDHIMVKKHRPGI